jgi:hypothetical protein
MQPPAEAALPTFLLPQQGRKRAEGVSPWAWEVPVTIAEAEDTARPFAQRSPVLPFEAPAAAADETSLPFEPRAPVLPFEAPAAAADETSLPFEPRAPVLPFAQAGAPSARTLSLEEYASLCAELSVVVETTFFRYGLGDPEIRRAVDETWRTRLSKDPKEYGSWQELYDHHRALLRPTLRQ